MILDPAAEKFLKPYRIASSPAGSNPTLRLIEERMRHALFLKILFRTLADVSQQHGVPDFIHMNRETALYLVKAVQVLEVAEGKAPRSLEQIIRVPVVFHFPIMRISVRRKRDIAMAYATADFHIGMVLHPILPNGAIWAEWGTTEDTVRAIQIA